MFGGDVDECERRWLMPRGEGGSDVAGWMLVEKVEGRAATNDNGGQKNEVVR